MSHGLSVLARCMPERPVGRMSKIHGSMRKLVRAMVQDAFTEALVRAKLSVGVGGDINLKELWEKSDAEKELWPNGRRKKNHRTKE